MHSATRSRVFEKTHRLLEQAPEMNGALGWRQQAGQLIGALVMANDDEAYEMAKKLMTWLKPDGEPEPEPELEPAADTVLGDDGDMNESRRYLAALRSGVKTQQQLVEAVRRRPLAPTEYLNLLRRPSTTKKVIALVEQRR